MKGRGNYRWYVNSIFSIFYVSFRTVRWCCVYFLFRGIIKRKYSIWKKKNCLGGRGRTRFTIDNLPVWYIPKISCVYFLYISIFSPFCISNWQIVYGKSWGIIEKILYLKKCLFFLGGGGTRFTIMNLAVWYTLDRK